MNTILFDAQVYTPQEVIEGGAVLIEDSEIRYVGPMEGLPAVKAQRFNLRGAMLAPGFIDVHVHAGKGVTFGAAEGRKLHEELEFYSGWVASNGVTGFLLSVGGPNPDATLKIIRDYVRILKLEYPGAKPLGLHLEGPFISKERKGAFNPSWLRDPSVEETKAYLEAGEGWIRQMTLAPELEGAEEVAALLRQNGVVAAMGHTNTDYDTASRALAGRYSHITHTYNAQSGFDRRVPGVYGAILSSDTSTCELIADLIHVHPAAIKILVRCVGKDRVVLITDAMAGAGLSDGVYELVGQKVTVVNGKATLDNGTIAGSTALMHQCVRNMVRAVGVPVKDALQMASLNPARSMGFADALGSLSAGKQASMVALDHDFNPILTVVDGRIVYNNL